MSQLEEDIDELNDEVGYLVYNETMINHFTHPRNVGEIENPDGMAVVGDPTCGDYVRVFIKVNDGKISAFKFLTMGCPGAISTSSIATELAIGKSLEEALRLTDNDVIKAAGGMPHLMCAHERDSHGPVDIFHGIGPIICGTFRVT